MSTIYTVARRSGTEYITVTLTKHGKLVLNPTGSSQVAFTRRQLANRLRRYLNRTQIYDLAVVTQEVCVSESRVYPKLVSPARFMKAFNDDAATAKSLRLAARERNKSIPEPRVALKDVYDNVCKKGDNVVITLTAGVSYGQQRKPAMARISGFTNSGVVLDQLQKSGNGCLRTVSYESFAKYAVRMG